MAEEEFFEMTIDGKKTKLSKKMAESQSKKEEKITVEINGRIVRVLPHMLKDIMKFGGHEQVKKVVKEPPKELLTIPLPKKLILPRVEASTLDVKTLEPVEPTSEYPGEVDDTPAKPVTRKKRK